MFRSRSLTCIQRFLIGRRSRSSRKPAGLRLRLRRCKTDSRCSPLRRRYRTYPGHKLPEEGPREFASEGQGLKRRDRKSTRLNSSHTVISYAVFCLKKKKKKK